MHILLVNDDGFDSRNLRLMAQACIKRGHRVTVVAPHTQQSAKSHAFTIFTPLLVHEAHMEGVENAYRVEGTPVDACRVGMLGLCEEKIDLVISGINEGYNIGLATFVSGTVGAAREAAFQGYPALAVSMEMQTPAETAEAFADYAVRTGEKMLHSKLPEQTVVNLNAPPVPLRQIRGSRMCPITRHVYKDGYDKRISPRGLLYFWLREEETDMHPNPGSDLDLLQKGFVTCSFLTPEGFPMEEYLHFPLPWGEDM